MKSERKKNDNPSKPVAVTQKIRVIKQITKNEAKPMEATRSNIMIECTLETKAAETFFLPLLSMALTKGFDNNINTPIYFAYYAGLTDLIKMLSTGIGVVSTRLRFVNKILAAYKPKNIPFKTGTIAYSWLNADSIGVNSEITIRKYKYYLFINSGGSTGDWDLQVAPPTPSSIEAATTVYSSVNTQVSDASLPFLENDATAELRKTYLKDVSPFSACSPYMGSADTSSSTGPFYSTELEVPKKSSILTGFCPYQDNAGRVPRVFSIAGGSACAPTGFPFIPQWSMKYFNTCYPVQYCFLDLDEVVQTLISWYIALVNKTRGSVNENTVYDAFYPFTCTPQQFRITVRQVVLQFFAASQSSSQFMTYTDNSNGFEPFRVSSNTYAKNAYSMKMPNLLVENLRMLLPRLLDISTKYHNNKNALIQIPVWGIYKGVEDTPPNAYAELYSDEGYVNQSLFDLGGKEDPNPIDGTFADGTVADLNSGLIKGIVDEWNLRIAQLQNCSVPLSYLSGSSDGNLLSYTRFCKYVSTEVDVRKLSRAVRHTINPHYIKTITRQKSEINLKTKSKESVVDQLYVPPAASLYSQRTVSVASMNVITNEVVQLFNYFILPTIVIEDDLAPTQRQWRSGNLQSHVYDVPDRSVTASFDSRGLKVDEVGSTCAPGQAGADTDEVANVIDTMSRHCRGGFIGDLLSALAHEIPI